MNWLFPERTQRLLRALHERILILDGAMGTMLQRHELDEAGYRGVCIHALIHDRENHKADILSALANPHALIHDRENHKADILSALSNYAHELKGNNDLLSLTQPQLIREVHEAYLEAGADLLETNTFNSTRISQADYQLEHLAYELNLAGARLAREACDAFNTLDKPRFAIGVLGPTSRTASLSPDVNDPGFRNINFEELASNYREAASGLIEGGVDAIMVETIFDTLNAKAALYALSELFHERAGRVPLMISGTITDRSGRTLSGQTAEAFWYSVRHARPLSVGLNCALGAAELRPHVQTLSDLAECHISTHPNAGLPNAFGGYDETPAQMAGVLAGFARDGLINILGGCCGSTPEHIRAISDAVRGIPPRALPTSLTTIAT